MKLFALCASAFLLAGCMTTHFERPTYQATFDGLPDPAKFPAARDGLSTSQKLPLSVVASRNTDRAVQTISQCRQLAMKINDNSWSSTMFGLFRSDAEGAKAVDDGRYLLALIMKRLGNSFASVTPYPSVADALKQPGERVVALLDVKADVVCEGDSEWAHLDYTAMETSLALLNSRMERICSFTTKTEPSTADAFLASDSFAANQKLMDRTARDFSSALAKCVP